jgi:hypothetical protein
VALGMNWLCFRVEENALQTIGEVKADSRNGL